MLLSRLLQEMRSAPGTFLLRLSVFAILVSATVPARAVLVAGERYNVEFQGFTGHTLSGSFTALGGVDGYTFTAGNWDLIVDGQHWTASTGAITAYQTAPITLGGSIGIPIGTGTFYQDGLLFDEFNPPKAYYTIDLGDTETTFPLTYSISPVAAIPEPNQTLLLLSGLALMGLAWRRHGTNRSIDGVAESGLV
jgi:hypothetical protein